ncbi:MAG TPA: SdrD B-like domain-containing protein [Arenicellales bacterium]|nr:SdrD B-like domain-containing protein [Arenicellales bacterium]
MTKVIKGQVTILFALLAAMVLTLAACGGGSSSTGGGAGGGGATVAGTVDNGVAFLQPAGGERPMLVALAESMVAPAQAAGVPGVTVQLLDSDGAVVDTQVTGDDGRFVFSGLAAGQYAISLQSSDGVFLGQAPVQVDPNTRTEIEMDVNGEIQSMEVEVEASGDTISGTVEDDSSSDDDASSDDDDSSDDVSDDDSSDDVSDDDSDDESID